MWYSIDDPTPYDLRPVPQWMRGGIYNGDDLPFICRNLADEYWAKEHYFPCDKPTMKVFLWSNDCEPHELIGAWIVKGRTEYLVRWSAEEVKP